MDTTTTTRDARGLSLTVTAAELPDTPLYGADDVTMDGPGADESMSDAAVVTAVTDLARDLAMFLGELHRRVNLPDADPALFGAFYAVDAALGIGDPIERLYALGDGPYRRTR